ncbi:MAG: alpha/beta hydrolase [Pseudomonadota bacterium]
MTLAPQASEYEINTSAGRLFVTEVGEGRPILLWPSIFTDHHVFDPIMPGLSGFRVVRVDGPGHGRSGAPTQPLTMAACGAAMIEIMDALGLETAVLGGTSWGGIAAAQAAVLAPDRVDAAVLMNTPMDLGAGRAGLATRFICAGARWMPKAALFRNGVARSFFQDPKLNRHPDYARAFHGMLRSADPRGLSAAVRAVLLESKPLRPLLANLTVPALVIAGEHDPMYAVSDLRSASETLSNGTLRIVPGNHISPVDAPDAVIEAMQAFLGS